MLLHRQNRGELVTFLRRCQPDLICVASLTQLLSADALASAPLGVINLHPSMLPRYHGPFPWFWQYHDFQLEIGVTVHALDEGQDTGPILAQEPLTLALGTDVIDATEIAAQCGGRLMATVADQLEEGRAQFRAQPAHDHPKARMVQRDERFIDWDGWGLERVWHFMRGTYPWVDAVKYPQEFVPAKRFVGGMERTDPHGGAGEVGRDSEGYYVWHPEGRIRLVSSG
jgi:methionyl-tRNA formyltransferase